MSGAWIRSLLGVEISDAAQAEILNRLGLSGKLQKGKVVCRIPAWRTDLPREIDLIEEIARKTEYRVQIVCATARDSRDILKTHMATESVFVIDDIVNEARAAQASGVHTFWSSQVFGHDALTALAIIGVLSVCLLGGTPFAAMADEKTE